MGCFFESNCDAFGRTLGTTHGSVGSGGDFSFTRTSCELCLSTRGTKRASVLRIETLRNFSTLTTAFVVGSFSKTVRLKRFVFVESTVFQSTMALKLLPQSPLLAAT